MNKLLRILFFVFFANDSTVAMNFKAVSTLVYREEYPLVDTQKVNGISVNANKPAKGTCVCYGIRITKDDSKREYFLQMRREQLYTSTPGRNREAIRGSVFPIHANNTYELQEEEPLSSNFIGELFNTLSVLYLDQQLAKDSQHQALLKTQAEARELKKLELEALQERNRADQEAATTCNIDIP